MLKRILIFLLTNTMLTLRPLLGPAGCCKYTITCTQFARHELATKPFLRAFKNITQRLLSCW